MTRRSSILTSVLALFVAMAVAMPAAASDRLPTPDTYLAQVGTQRSSGDSSQQVDRLPTPDMYLAQRGLTAGPAGEPTVVSSSPVNTDDGFDWGDALIGALTAAGLTLITLAAARSVARHRGTAAESRA